MSWTLLSPALVDAIHDEVLNPGELQGRALDKSLESVLARVDNRLAYGMIGDVCDLAAAYATAIARRHCFNDGNKRTAFRAMNLVLALNGVARDWQTEEVGGRIVLLARGALDDTEFAGWLRGLG